jgi:tripartite ATP-independent transporter DctP family solute receptor
MRKAGFLVIGLFFWILFPLCADAQKPTVLTIGHGSAVGSIEDLAVQKIAQVAKEKSKGQLDLQVFPAAQLGNFVSMMESVIAGSQDIVWGDLTWLGNIEKDFQILSMGYAFRDQNHINAFIDSAASRAMQKKLLEKKLLLLRAHANQLPRVTVSKMPIKSPQELQGVKMRVPGIPIFLKLWEAMGTKPTSVNWGEVYIALSQGVVDAMECGYEFIYPHKFHEVAKYVTLTDHVRGLRGFLINPKRYQSLPESLQKVILEAAIAGEELYNAEVEKARKEHTEKLLAEKAIINTVDLQPFKAKVVPIVDKLETEGFWSPGLFKAVQEIR